MIYFRHFIIFYGIYWVVNKHLSNANHMLTQNKTRVCGSQPWMPIWITWGSFSKLPRPHPRAVDVFGSAIQTLCFKDFAGNSSGQLGLRIAALSHCDMRRQVGRSAISRKSTLILLSLRAAVLKIWSPNQQQQHNPATHPPGDSDACLVWEPL